MRRRVVLSRRGAAKRNADFKSQIEFTCVQLKISNCHSECGENYSQRFMLEKS